MRPPSKPTDTASASSSGPSPSSKRIDTASASSSGSAPSGKRIDTASASSSGVMKPTSKRIDTASASSSGLTVMVITQSGKKARRMNIPRWLIFAAAFAWLSIMVAAFVWGFESAAPKRKPDGKTKTYQGSIERSAMGPSPSSRQ